MNAYKITIEYEILPGEWAEHEFLNIKLGTFDEMINHCINKLNYSYRKSAYVKTMEFIAASQET